MKHIFFKHLPLLECNILLNEFSVAPNTCLLLSKNDASKLATLNLSPRTQMMLSFLPIAIMPSSWELEPLKISEWYQQNAAGQKPHLAWEKISFATVDDQNSNCLAGLRCPNCGQQHQFLIEVNGVDPQQVDPMDSQSAIMAKVSVGDVSMIDYTAKMTDDGSEDTVSDVTYAGAISCPECDWKSSIDEARCLHNN